MPELPEVETVRRGLAPHLNGATLARVEQRRPDLRFPLPQRFAERLTGARIAAIERRAKYLTAELDTGETLVAHLGMTGRFTVQAPGGEGEAPGVFHYDAGADPKHTHVLFETAAGAVVGFNDARRFGYMELIDTDALGVHPWFARLGPEPLGPLFHVEHLRNAFAGRAQNVKATLLDQAIVAGLGNIYVCEALHRAGVDPKAAAGALPARRLAKLVAAIKAVLAEAIEAGGSTLRDYRSADGALGYFQHSFRAYGREDDPCVKARCRGIVRRIVQGGRSTFYCPMCQR